MGGGSGNVLQFLSRPILSGVPGLGDLKSLLALLSLCPRVSLDDVYDDLVMVLLDVASQQEAELKEFARLRSHPCLRTALPSNRTLQQPGGEESTRDLLHFCVPQPEYNTTIRVPERTAQQAHDR